MRSGVVLSIDVDSDELKIISDGVSSLPTFRIYDCQNIQNHEQLRNCDNVPEVKDLLMFQSTASILHLNYFSLLGLILPL